MLPGDDWKDVPEGVEHTPEHTPEQMARRFLSLSWEEQVFRMGRFKQDSSRVVQCYMSGHEGAMEFSRLHVCPSTEDAYKRGWADALNRLEQQVEAHFNKGGEN